MYGVVYMISMVDSLTARKCDVIVYKCCDHPALERLQP